MKKLGLICTIILASIVGLQAQSHQKGDFQFAIGIGMGIYGTELESEINGVKSSESDGTAAILIPIRAQYSISNKFSIGLMVQPANYIEDSSNTNNEKVSGASFRLITNYYFLNKEKYNLYAGLGIGSASLHQEAGEKNVDFFEADWTGGNVELGMGINRYFGNHIGFFFDIAYDSYSFNLDEIVFNSVKVKPDNWSLALSGAEFRIGLIAKF